MRIVAGRAVRGSERLIVMRLLQRRILHIVAIEAERRSRLGQVKLVLGSRIRAALVRRVAGVASHVERGMTAALLGNVQALVVAREAKIVFLVSDRRFQ